MTRQYRIGNLFVNETGTRQYRVGSFFVNETVSAATGNRRRRTNLGASGVQLLAQSTAFTTIVGPILDSTGAEYTSAVIGDLSITKNGTTAAMAAAATLTHISNGYYTLVGTTGNSDTLGRADVTCNKSTYQMPPARFTVVTATAFATLVTNGTIASTSSGRTIVVDAAGLADANMVKSGPSGSGTAQTTGDIYGKISPSTFPAATLAQVGDAMALTPSERTTLTAVVWNALTSGMSTVGSIGKRIIDYLTGDAFARLGAPAGASIAEDIAANATSLATLLSRVTSARAGYLDNLNTSGIVASQADITALNQSASRRVILTSVPQFERPESGNSTYTIEARTYDGDGAATNADSDPTLTATGSVSGSLAANLGTVSNPATGVYRWTYTVASAATNEQIRFDISATMSTAFTLSLYSQVVDLVSVTFNSTDRLMITAGYNKLPTNNIADQTVLATAIATAQASIDVIDGIVDTILADTNELQTDWANGGRLDLLIDSILLAVSTNGVALSAATCNKIADHVRRRQQSNVELSSDGDALAVGSEYGFIQQAQESSIAGGTMTIKKTDGTTTLGTKTVTSGTADPITGIS